MSTDGRNDVTIPQSCSDSATAVAVLTAGFGYKTNGRMPPLGVQDQHAFLPHCPAVCYTHNKSAANSRQRLII